MALCGGNLVASGGHHYDQERGKCYPIPFNLGLMNLEHVQLSMGLFAVLVHYHPIERSPL